MSSPLRQYCQYAEGGKTEPQEPGIYPQEDPWTFASALDERMIDTPFQPVNEALYKGSGKALDWVYKRLGLEPQGRGVTVGDVLTGNFLPISLDTLTTHQAAAHQRALVEGKLDPIDDALDDAVYEGALTLALGAGPKAVGKKLAKTVRQGYRSAKSRLGRLLQDHEVTVHEEPATAP